MLFNSQDKCSRLLGGKMVESSYNKLNQDRETAFLAYFKDKNLEKRIKISADQNVIPYNGFSFYKIDYKGEFPEKLLEAYMKMNELNDRAPRNLFKKERRKLKNIF